MTYPIVEYSYSEGTPWDVRILRPEDGFLRRVPDYPRYEVARWGAVISRRTDGGYLFLRPCDNGAGYKYVILFNEGKRRKVYIHRLVMEAFVGPCPGDMEVRHLDGDPSNNKLENLAYGSKSENTYDSVLHGTHQWARRTHCRRGHEYTADNIYITPKRPTARYCRKCMKINQDNYKERHQAR